MVERDASGQSDEGEDDVDRGSRHADLAVLFDIDEPPDVDHSGGGDEESHEAHQEGEQEPHGEHPVLGPQAELLGGELVAELVGDEAERHDADHHPEHADRPEVPEMLLEVGRERCVAEHDQERQGQNYHGDEQVADLYGAELVTFGRDVPEPVDIHARAFAYN